MIAGKEVDVMANYVTNTSDKSKKTALAFWAVGGLGLFGFENYYVLKIKRGLLHTLWGIMVCMAIYAATGDEMQIPLGILFWAFSSLPNLFKLLFGVFKDNVGQNLRN